jgi:hypothetical protein
MVRARARKAEVKCNARTIYPYGLRSSPYDPCASYCTHLKSANTRRRGPRRRAGNGGGHGRASSVHADGGGERPAVPRRAAAAVGQVGGGDPRPAQGGAGVAGHVRDGRGRSPRLRRGRAPLPRQPRQAQLPRGRAPDSGRSHDHSDGGGHSDGDGVPGQRRLRVPAVPDASAGRTRGLSSVLRRRRRRHEQLVVFVPFPRLLGHCAFLGVLCSGLRRRGAVGLAGERVELPGDHGFLVRVELSSTDISIVRTSSTCMIFFFRRKRSLRKKKRCDGQDDFVQLVSVQRI